MKVAHIVPINHLSQIKGNSIQMCLAPIAKQYPEYLNFYKEESKNGSFVILDNGMFEGALLPNQEIIELATEIQASEIVAPDYLGSSQKTIEAIESFAKVSGSFAIMVVPHGNTFDSLVRCFKRLYIEREQLYINTFGFSYLSFETATRQIRSIFAPHIIKAPWWKEKVACHLLGVTKSLIGIAELALLDNFRFFRSLDTSLAACVTAHGHELKGENQELEESHFSRPEKFFELILDNDLLERNLGLLECFANVNYK